MKFRATYRNLDLDGIPETPELVVIINIWQFHQELSPIAIFVRADGTIGEDTIYHFTIVEGAW